MADRPPHEIARKESLTRMPCHALPCVASKALCNVDRLAGICGVEVYGQKRDEKKPRPNRLHVWNPRTCNRVSRFWVSNNTTENSLPCFSRAPPTIWEGTLAIYKSVASLLQVARSRSSSSASALRRRASGRPEPWFVEGCHLDALGSYLT